MLLIKFQLVDQIFPFLSLFVQHNVENVTEKKKKKSVHGVIPRCRREGAVMCDKDVCDGFERIIMDILQY